MGRHILLLITMLLVGCGSGTKEPEIFLPRVLGPEGADLDSLRSLYCRGASVDLDNILTPENFRSIFNCANYDKSLEDLKPLFTSEEFPAFLKNMNLILKSDNTQNLKESLRPWFEEGPQGASRLDRLLPALAKVIKNPSFQEGLPIIDQLLEAGENVWRELLPGLADLVYQERFPDNFEDVSLLFQELNPEASDEKDYSVSIKKWANFIKSEYEGKSVALRVLELGDRIKNIELRGTSIQEYLDHMNEKGVFVSIYLDNGAVRGEVLDPKLNADPEEDEIREGLTLTPEQRRERAYRKLFARGKNGEDAPIVQLAGMVEEFHRDHPEFLSSLATWLSANGPRLSEGLSEYVVRGQVQASLSRLSINAFLSSFAREVGKSPQGQISASDFGVFLRSAFTSSSFTAWVERTQNNLNQELFGPRNGELLRGAALSEQTAALYNLPALAEFGESLIPRNETLALNQAIRAFSSGHRDEKLKLNFNGVIQGIQSHLVDLWWQAAKSTMGESVVIDWAMKLAQAAFLESAAAFPDKKVSLSEWYFSSPYGNPGTTEMIAGYAFKELDLFPRYLKNRVWLKEEFANEVFASEDDKRAFRLLVDQVPNIWLYLRSGMSRSGNDLMRALTSKDRGYLVRGYVDLLASAQRTGWIRDAVLLIEAYHRNFEPVGERPPVSDGLEERRQISKGADALKRVMRSLFEAEEKGNYSTATLGRVLLPVSSLVSEQRRRGTERFLVASADEIIQIPDHDLNEFLRDLMAEKDEASRLKRRETIQAVAELLREPVFPDVIRQLSLLFREDAVKPALDFLARKIEDGSLQSVLLFIRRILGFRG